MSSRLLTSPMDLRRSKSHRTTLSTNHRPQHFTETSSLNEEPLPAAPKTSTGVLRRLLPRRRDSIALPRVVEGLNWGVERVRRCSLRAGLGLGFTNPTTLETTPNLEITSRSTSKSNTSSLRTCSQLKSETNTVTKGEEDVDTSSDEEAEAERGLAVVISITPVRARLVYIGCRGLDS